jgi:hypothetical protein
MNSRLCLRLPIPEIEEAANYLDAAVSAHLGGDYGAARELLHLADSKVVWDWTDSVWGKKSPYTLYRPVPNSPATLEKNQRAMPRYATLATQKLVHERDGYYCRFCKIPVVRDEIRVRISRAYPDAAPWGNKNHLQHAGLQCMWAQYDHIVPHSRGGGSDIDNILLTCAACNYGRMQFTLEEVGLLHPDTHAARRGPWDGLERFQ